MKRYVITALSVGLLTAGTAQAGSLIFSGSSGTRSASVTFTDNGGNLEVILKNTGNAATTNIDVLTAFYFSLSGVGTLTPASIDLNGSTLVNGSLPAGMTLGDEWAYDTGAYTGNANRGISSSGLSGFFGASSAYFAPSPNDNLNGPSFGIVSAAYVAGTGNGNFGSLPVYRDQIKFVLSGWTGGVLGANNNQFSNVGFQYGTAPTEPYFCASTNGNTCGGGGGGGGENPPVPEPATLGLMGVGLGAAAWMRRRASSK